jgi:hypothetical protein
MDICEVDMLRLVAAAVVVCVVASVLQKAAVRYATTTAE